MKPIERDDQYRSVGYLEDALRKVADETPAWLYDEVRLGSLIDSLNEARFKYEQKTKKEMP